MPRGGKRARAGRPFTLDPETEWWAVYVDFRERWKQLSDDIATATLYKERPQLAAIADIHEQMRPKEGKFPNPDTLEELVGDVQDHLRDLNRIPDDEEMSWKDTVPRRYRKELRRPQGERMALLKELAEKYSRAFNKRITPRTVERCVEQGRALENRLRTETPDES